MQINRRRKRTFLFLFSVLGTAIILFAIALYLLMDSGKSLGTINKLTKTEVEKKVEIEEPKNDIKKDLTEFIDNTAKQATEVINDLGTKKKDDINTKVEEKSKGTEKEESKGKSILDKWWVLIGAYFLFKLVFGRD